MKQEQQTLPLLFELAVVVAQHLKLALRAGYVLILSFQFSKACLAFGQLTLSLDYLTFDLPQLIYDTFSVHRFTLPSDAQQDMHLAS
ncbi:hypothetical protein [Bradyrhizobium sp. USDA 4516]